jgi:hypothetical protein
VKVAYDLHIVRSAHWTDAANAPITKNEVDNLISSDSELAWSTSDFVQMKGQTGAVTTFYMIQWNGTSCFWWYRDQILCSDPNEAQVAKLVRMARALNARAIGDDGERYELRRSLLGKEKIVQIDPE